MTEFASFDPEDIFADVTQHPDRAINESIEAPVRRLSLQLFLVGILLLLLLFAARTFSLTVQQSASLIDIAKRSRERVFLISPNRGAILDTNGLVLAENEPAFALIYDPLLAKAEDEAVRILDIVSIRNTLDIEAQQIATWIVEHGQRSDPLILATDISQEDAVTLTAAFSGETFRVEAVAKRVYAEDAKNFGMVIGYVGAISEDELATLDGYGPNDAIGKAGIERTWEEVLRGEAGERRVLIDAKGTAQKTADEVAAKPGRTLRLTLDAELNRVVHEALARGIRLSGAEGGSVVIVDVETGALRALASLPTFDPQALSDGLTPAEYETLLSDSQNPFLNRVVSGMYPAGSTIKPFIGAAALQENVVSPQKRIDASAGYINVTSVFDPDISWTFRDWKSHGFVNIIDALARSSNVYFYTVGGGYGDIKGLGADRITQYLAAFGFGEKLGIDLPSEAAGRIPTPDWKRATFNESWYVGDTYNLSIGQGNVGVTPLQLAVATAAIANGGTVYVPYVVEAILSMEGVIEQQIEPKIYRTVPVTDENLYYIRQGMRAAVTAPYGTSRSLATLPISSAAKTGTAEYGDGTRTHALVTVFAPYKNPEIAIAVVLDGGGQGTLATAVARQILEWYGSPER